MRLKGIYKYGDGKKDGEKLLYMYTVLYIYQHLVTMYISCNQAHIIYMY